MVDVLIIDDEADIRDLISDVLRDEGYTTRTAKDSDHALKSLAERVPAAIILDIWLQGSELDGLGILEIAQKRYPNVPVVMISGHGNIETAVMAIKMGAYDFIEKPFQQDRLLLVIRRAIENARLRLENTELRTRGVVESQLIGTSNAMQQVLGAIEKVSPTHSRIMITGPAGAGKEVAARVIHSKSKRASGPFVVLNTAALSSDKVDAELFGIEDTNPAGGAEKVGTFERAHGGTLFIDEVADMPLETQVKVLRALQDQAIERVRGTRKVPVDVRVIAASNKDLPAEIQAGNLREDLYYRLNVVPIKIPALKDRRDDIPELCVYFLRRCAEIHGLRPRKLADDAVAILQTNAWPGNVRQLRNMMERLLILATDGDTDIISADMLPPELYESTPVLMKPDSNADIMSMALREARELFEKQYLAAQISRFGGNISKTSTFVGMERSALHRKLKLLGLASEDRLDKVS